MIGPNLKEKARMKTGLVFCKFCVLTVAVVTINYLERSRSLQWKWDVALFLELFSGLELRKCVDRVRMEL